MLDALEGIAGFVFNLDLLSTYGWRLLQGLRITAEVVLISCSLGFLLSYPLARGRSGRPIQSQDCRKSAPPRR